MVGRARLELATNGLKDVELCFNSIQGIGLNLPGLGCGIGEWLCGLEWDGGGAGWFRHCPVGVSRYKTLILSGNPTTMYQ